MSTRLWRGRAIEVAGRIAEEGVCGECTRPGGRWTIRARLTPWAQRGCAPTAEPLEILHEGPREVLAELQRRWPPGHAARARVRPAAAPMTAWLVAVRG